MTTPYPGAPDHFWRLDDAAGGPYLDSVGAASLVASGTPARTAGRPGALYSTASAHLDGGSQLLTAAGLTGVSLAAGVEVSCLVYLDTLTYAGICGWWDGGLRQFQVYYYAGRVSLSIVDAAASAETVLDAGPAVAPVPAGTWLAVLAYYDPTRAQIGVNAGGGWYTTPATAGIAAGGGAFVVGYWNTYYLAGRVQALSVYLGNRTEGQRAAALAALARPLPLPLVACTGNSIVHGYPYTPSGPTPDATAPYPAQLQARLGAGVTVANYGADGQTIEQMITDDPALVDPTRDAARHGNVLIAWDGVNSMASRGDTGPEAYAALATYVQARQRQGWIVLVLTAMRATPTTDNTPGGYESQRPLYNAAVMANACGADAVLDVTTDPRLDDPTDTAYFFDGVHLTRAGYSAVVDQLLPPVRKLTPGASAPAVVVGVTPTALVAGTYSQLW